MQQLSTETRSVNNAPEVLSWYYVLPGIKLVKLWHIAIALMGVSAVIAILALIDFQLIFESVWILLILPVVTFFAGWLVLELQPHQQIYYRLDNEGIYSEFRSTSAPIVNFVDLIIGIIGTKFGRDDLYLNKHSTRQRHFEWDEIVGIRQNPYWRKIVLIAGLRGQMVLWANTENYTRVLTLVNDHVQKKEKNYD